MRLCERKFRCRNRAGESSAAGKSLAEEETSGSS